MERVVLRKDSKVVYCCASATAKTKANAGVLRSAQNDEGLGDWVKRAIKGKGSKGSKGKSIGKSKDDSEGNA
jgi:hypothetical protein